MNRLVQAGQLAVFAPRAHRSGSQYADRACEHRGLVAQDVAEHVLGEEHVEAARGQDELHGRVVHEQVLELDSGVVACDLGHDLPPEL